jgi:hypothetical protein
MPLLPYTRAADLSDHQAESAWLVEGLWGDGAVGILGGEPKCCKSIFSLELAIAVSSGAACLGRYAVKRQGTVLLYAAEDALRIVKLRLEGIAAARGLALAACDIQVITSERLRLDNPSDLEALDATLATLKPSLLILDPFVRLHRIDENSSAEVALVLEHLRVMQRRHKTAIVIVHHSKKNGGSSRAGQALRGSSEFHAWGDSNLYLRRTAGDRILLSIEHRAAASVSGIPLALKAKDDSLYLEIIDDGIPIEEPKKLSPDKRIERALLAHQGPMSLADLREAAGLKTATLCGEIKRQMQLGLISKTAEGYALMPS